MSPPDGLLGTYSGPTNYPGTSVHTTEVHEHTTAGYSTAEIIILIVIIILVIVILYYFFFSGTTTTTTPVAEGFKFTVIHGNGQVTDTYQALGGTAYFFNSTTSVNLTLHHGANPQGEIFSINNLSAGSATVTVSNVTVPGPTQPYVIPAGTSQLFIWQNETTIRPYG
jgi:hypothetical protein